MTKEYKININTIPSKIETMLTKIILNDKGNYAKLDETKIKNIMKKTNFYDKNIIESLRSQLLKEKIIKRHKRLTWKKQYITEEYNKNSNKL